MGVKSFSSESDPAGAQESHAFLEFEALALLGRLNLVKPFALQMTSVPAAAVSVRAQAGIEHVLGRGRRELRQRVGEFLDWLKSGPGRRSVPAEAQRRFSLLRLRFNAVLTQLDLFSNALVQRSEHEHGVWLGGLDVLAADALALPGYYDPPAVICYLDRGAGAAIRRARTRLPGGGENPVAIIRVPRERMVGNGIASSLVHEVGHQAAALLDLITSLRPELRSHQEAAGEHRSAWRFWERWISEIIADFWAVARVGVGATTGLIGVVSLPRAFVFRVTPNDPHPFPWIRVKLSCLLGNSLFPDPQWDQLSRLWDAFYPLAGLDESRTELITNLLKTAPDLAQLLIEHRPQSLGGNSLAEALGIARQTPARLRELGVHRLESLNPTLAMAVLGQARADGALSPDDEGNLVGRLLTHWAVGDAIGRHSVSGTGTHWGGDPGFSKHHLTNT